MKTLLISLCFTVLFLAGSQNILACSCTYVGAGDANQSKSEIDRRKAVFSGEVLAIREDSISSRTVKLKIQQSWKGQQSDEISLTTGSKFGCGYDFEVGKSYLVFANGADDATLTVSQCSSTSELNKADALMEMLKKLGSEAAGRDPNLIGSVYDANGAVIRHAQIKLKAADGKLYEATIGDDDLYRLSVPAGSYSVEVSAEAFKTATINNYRVSAPALGQQNLDFKLEVGATICIVTITEPVKNN